MGDVVPLFGTPEDQGVPTMTGEAFCILCDKEWVATAPVGTVWLECPDCHVQKGLFAFPAMPPEGTYVRECDCGNQLFILTPDGHFCPNCGQYQLYD